MKTSLRYGYRDILIEQGQFWADGGDDFFIVSHNLADLLAAIDLMNATYEGTGQSPDWENRFNKVTVIADFAKDVPADAVLVNDTHYAGRVWRREGSGATTWWTKHVADNTLHVRAFTSKARAEAWLTSTTWGVKRADKEHVVDIEAAGF